jgi:hypothetical protein
MIVDIVFPVSGENHSNADLIRSVLATCPCQDKSFDLLIGFRDVGGAMACAMAERLAPGAFPCGDYALYRRDWIYVIVRYPHSLWDYLRHAWYQWRNRREF